MASQPLETIPEEPTAAPTPARVTTDPPKTKPAKNSGRVASGKRLAERNRLAREAKKKAEAEAANKDASPAPATATASKTEEACGSSGLSIVALLGIGGLIVSAAGVYYQREAIRQGSSLHHRHRNRHSQRNRHRLAFRLNTVSGKWSKFKHYIYFHHGVLCARSSCWNCARKFFRCNG